MLKVERKLSLRWMAGALTVALLSAGYAAWAAPPPGAAQPDQTAAANLCVTNSCMPNSAGGPGAAAGASSASGAAGGQNGAAPPRPTVITEPVWAARPGPEDFADAYPSEAKAQGIAGRAGISCSVTAAGTLSNCSVTSENPAGYGFGQAAVRLGSGFQMAPTTKLGAPVEGGTFATIINFGIPAP